MADTERCERCGNLRVPGVTGCPACSPTDPHPPADDGGTTDGYASAASPRPTGGGPGPGGPPWARHRHIAAPGQAAETTALAVAGGGATPVAPTPRSSTDRAVVVTLAFLAVLAVVGVGGFVAIGDGDADRSALGPITPVAPANDAAPTRPLTEVQDRPPAVAASPGRAPIDRVPVDSGMGLRWSMPASPQEITQDLTADGVQIRTTIWTVETDQLASGVVIYDLGSRTMSNDNLLKTLTATNTMSIGEISDATFLGGPARSATATMEVDGRPFRGQVLAATRPGRAIVLLSLADGGDADAVQQAEFEALVASMILD